MKQRSTSWCVINLCLKMKAAQLTSQNDMPFNSYLRPRRIKHCIICQYMNPRRDLGDKLFFLLRSVGYINHSLGMQISQYQVKPVVLICLLHNFLRKLHRTLFALQPKKLVLTIQDLSHLSIMRRNQYKRKLIWKCGLAIRTTLRIATSN